MKKYILFFFALSISFSAFSKKIKFSVSMKNTPLNITGAGIHVAGTFQTYLGASSNWDPAFNPMIKDLVDTNVYSLVVDLPANKMYEYKYINGDQTYEVEFVPQESRIQYFNNDSRWIYLDSTSNDTTFIGTMPFSGNHPVGTYLLRFKTCLPNSITLNTKGLHVAGSFNGWDISQHTMYSFDGQKYEYIAYVDSTIMNYEYKFANGNTLTNYETVPTTCASNTNRTVMMIADLELSSFEFNSCSICDFSSAANNINSNQYQVLIYPNPVINQVTLISNQFKVNTIEIRDIVGRKVVSSSLFSNQSSAIIDVSSLNNGIYFATLTDQSGNHSTHKITIQH
jgi:hypothetical protein